MNKTEIEILNDWLYDFGLRYCTKCRDIKTLLEFHVSSRSPHGRMPHCKVCRSAAQKTTKGILESRKAMRRYWQSANGHACKQAYAHSKKGRETQKKYSKNHKEKISAYNKEYSNSQIGQLKLLEARLKYEASEKGQEKRWFLGVKRRNRLLSTLSTLTAKEWREIKLNYNSQCAYCCTEQKNLTQDHVVPVSKGGEHTRENIVPACRKCNSSKGSKMLFFEWEPHLPHRNLTQHSVLSVTDAGTQV